MTIMPKSILFLFFSIFTLYTWSAIKEVKTEESVDLSRYLGTWHQIALVPNNFQRKCVRGTVAHYSARSDGHLEVMNSCEDKDGTVIRAVGVARVNSDYKSTAKLEVSFAPEWMNWLGFVWGGYWILEIDADYQAVLVGSPDLKYLWILARGSKMKKTTFQQFLHLAEGYGYPVESLVMESGTGFLDE